MHDVKTTSSLAVRCEKLGGDSGTGLVFLHGEVVGMHVQVADTLLEQLDRDQLGDQQMADVAESLAAAATSMPQAKVALLCHVLRSE